MPEAPPVTARFAPSPTGNMHLGNARVAVANALLARRHGGRLLLRIDDTDRERSKARFEAAIRDDLRWLGIAWDAEARQSDRAGEHARAFDRLLAARRVYPAYETPAELDEFRADRRARGLPPRYGRAALDLSDADRARLEGEGRRPHWRFRLSDGEAAFEDLIRGPRRLPLSAFSDPVVRRADGAFPYAFASAVDDLGLGVTHVVRGEDHLANTASQLDLMAALAGPDGPPPPAFAHLPLLLGADGAKLSKRVEALSLGDLRERGVEPGAVVALLAALGTGRAPDPAADLGGLAAAFDLAALGTAQPRLDPADLARLSAARLRAAPFEAVAPRLAALGLGGADAAFWDAVRPNLDTLADAAAWWRALREPLAPPELAAGDAAHLAAAAAALAASPDAAAWLEALKAGTGRKGKALYGPLRLALTGREHGPPLPDLVAIIGRDRALRRLRGETC